MRHLLDLPTVSERHKLAQVKAFLKVAQAKAFLKVASERNIYFMIRLGASIPP